MKGSKGFQILVTRLYVYATFVAFLFSSAFFAVPVSSEQELKLPDGYKTELVQYRDEYTKIFQVIDSSTQRGYRLVGETSSGRVHYKSGNEYKTINNNLVLTSYNGYKWTNAANDFHVYFGKNLQDGFRYVGNGLDLKIGKISIGEKIKTEECEVVAKVVSEEVSETILKEVTDEFGEPVLDENGEQVFEEKTITKKVEVEKEVEECVTKEYDKQLNNSVGVVAENKITYPEILPNIDLVYSVNSTGFSKQIVLKNKSALNNDLSRIDFQVKNSNRNLVQQGGRKGEIKVSGLNDLQFINPFTFDQSSDKVSEEIVDLSADDKRITIVPSQDYLNSSERIFPIIIDPEIQTKTVTADSFVSTSTGLTPQGKSIGTPKKPLFVGNYNDTVISAWYTDSRTFLKFPDINAPVAWAKLKVYHYGTTGSPFSARVKKVDNFNENSLIWADNPWMSSTNYGTIHFPYILQQNNSYERVSTDIGALVNEQVGSGRIGIGLKSPDESSWDGAVFCSKDWTASHCSGKMPVLEYELNYPPYIPGTISPDNNVYYSGNCDESVSPATGECRIDKEVDYQIDNIGDGEKLVTDSTNKTKVKIQLSSDNSTFSDLSGYLPATGYVYDQTTLNIATPDGRYYWRPVVMEDINGTQITSLENPGTTPSKVFTTDTTPPSVPEFTLPEFSQGTQNQFQLTAPSTDNVTENQELAYQVEVSEFSDFSTIFYTSPWINTDALSPNPTFEITSLSDDTQYYYRVKSRDRVSTFIDANVSAWSIVQSSVQDSVSPLLFNQTVDYERFSPSNPTSVGDYDSVQISFDFSEKNFENAKVEIRDASSNLIKTLESCEIGGLFQTCDSSNVTNNYTNHTDPTDPTNFTNIKFVWDGKDSTSNYVVDGAYTLTLVVTDKAGNVSDSSLSENNKIVILDDTGANIGITFPINNYWTNQNSVEFSGAVAGFNQADKMDDDFSKLFVKNVSSGIETEITSSVDASKNFTYNESLNLGKNTFSFKTIDTVANEIGEVGDPAVSTEIEWVINREETNPDILSISPTGALIGGVSNRNPLIEFQVQDSDSAGDLSQTSGLQTGTNPTNYDISLLRSFDQTTWSEVPIYKNGVNVSGGLAGDLICTPQTGDKDSLIDCQTQLINLQPDGYYKIFVRIKDNAGNYTCNYNYTEVSEDIKCSGAGDEFENIDTEFILDSYTYLNQIKPIEGSVFNHSDVYFEGYSEKGAELKIENQQLDRGFRITLDESKNGFLPEEFEVSTGAVIYDENNTEISGLPRFARNDIEIICGEYRDIDSDPTTPDVEVCKYAVTLNQKNNFVAVYDPASPPAQVSNKNTISVTDFGGNVETEIRNAVIDLYAINLSAESNLTYLSPNGDGRQDGSVFSTTATNSNNPDDLTQIVGYSLQIKNAADEIVREFSGTDVLPNQIFFDGKDENSEWLTDGNYTFSLQIETSDGVVLATDPSPILVRSEMTDEVIITSPNDGFVTTRGAINVQGQAPIDSNIDDYQTTNLRGETFVEICVDTVGTSVTCDITQTASVDENGFFSTVIILPTENSPTTHYITAIAKDNFGNQTPDSNQVKVILDTTDPFKNVKITPTFNGLNTEQDIQDFIDGVLTLDDVRSFRIEATVSQNTEALDIDYADYTNVQELPGTDLGSGYADLFYSDGEIATINNQTTNPGNILNPGSDPTIKKNYLPNRGFAIPAADQEFCDQAECVWAVNYPVPYFYSGGQYEVQFTGYKGSTIEKAYSNFVLDGRLASAPMILRIEKQNPDGSYQVLRGHQDKQYTNQREIRLTGVADTEAVLDIKVNGVVVDTITPSFTGKWEYSYTLPDADSDYEFSLTARVGASEQDSLENEIVVLDRVIPEIDSVETMVPAKGYNPHLNTGDRVNVTLNSSEPLVYSDLIKEDGFTKSLFSWSDNRTLFTTEFYIEREEEGLYYPTLYLEDIAGNGVSYINDLNSTDATIIDVGCHPEQSEGSLGDDTFCYQPQNQSESKDFRIFIDNTHPEKTEIDKTNWGDSIDGLKADGIFPEMDRLVDYYVTKENSVTLTGYAEKNQRVLIYYNTGGDTLQEVLAEVWVGNENNTDCHPESSQDQIGIDNYVTKFGIKCKWEFTYNFNDNGESPNGIPKNWYLFQAVVSDLAGNLSEYDDSIIIYHDTEKPKYTNISNIRSESYDPIVDWNNGNTEVSATNPPPITKDTEITTTHHGERQSDIEYILMHPRSNVSLSEAKNLLETKLTNTDDSEWLEKNNNYQEHDFVYDEGVFAPSQGEMSEGQRGQGVNQYKILRNGDNSKNETFWGETDFELGSEERDEARKNCTTMDGTRKVGTCDDGVYALMMRMTDTSGNQSEWVTRKVERDTVAPAVPEISVYKTGSVYAEYLGVEVNGEANTTANVKVDIDGRTWNKYVKLNQEGYYKTDNLIGKLWCESKYTITTKLFDRADNVSDVSDPKSITTSECLGLGGGTGEGTESDPWGGSYGSDLPEVTVDVKARLDGTYNITNIQIPAPIITYIETLKDGTVNVYGVVIPKGHKLNANIKIEYFSRNEAFELCDVTNEGTLIYSSHKRSCVQNYMGVSNYFDWWKTKISQCSDIDCMNNIFETERIVTDGNNIAVEIPNSLLSFDKNSNQYIGGMWNDSSDGRFMITFKLDEDVKVGDKIKTHTSIFGDFTYDGIFINYRGTNPVYAEENQGIRSPYSNEKVVPKKPKEMFSIPVPGGKYQCEFGGYSGAWCSSNGVNKYSYESTFGAHHWGIDIMTSSVSNKNLYAAFDGKITRTVYSAPTGGHSFNVEYYLPDGRTITARYVHAKAGLLVNKTMKVGDYIGKVMNYYDSSGAYQVGSCSMRTTVGMWCGEHLHFEIVDRGTKKDPCDYIEGGCPALGKKF